jgi:hypothetical protein
MSMSSESLVSELELNWSPVTRRMTTMKMLKGR